MQASPVLVDLNPPADGKIRVLIADDESHIRSVVSHIVTVLGGEVAAEAGDGEKALALFESARPDLAILDIKMRGCLDLGARNCNPPRKSSA